MYLGGIIPAESHKSTTDCTLPAVEDYQLVWSKITNIFVNTCKSVRSKIANSLVGYSQHQVGETNLVEDSQLQVEKTQLKKCICLICFGIIYQMVINLYLFSRCKMY